jgi:hypothetical protein
MKEPPLKRGAYLYLDTPGQLAIGIVAHFIDPLGASHVNTSQSRK